MCKDIRIYRYNWLSASDFFLVTHCETRCHISISGVSLSLVQGMAWPSFGVKPLPEPIPSYCHLGTREKRSELVGVKTKTDYELTSTNSFSKQTGI